MLTDIRGAVRELQRGPVRAQQLRRKGSPRNSLRELVGHVLRHPRIVSLVLQLETSLTLASVYRYFEY